jgi:cellulose synthase/poly-beta-1,6-N-acetylglucosamine synthase-like glycosyltransferase
MFEVIFLIVVSVYFLANSFIIIGMRKKFRKANIESLPHAAVLVAARNEEEHILKCLESLDTLVYPDGKLEIIIADDNSTDRTGSIIDEFISGKEKFRKLIVTEQHGRLKGKVNALAEGIKASKGEIILITDADCVVNPLWAETIASYYDKNTGIVNGFTTQKIYSAFSGMQAVDFIYLLAVASGTINQKLPVSCIGNNMSFRKQAYLDTGGYEKLPFSVTEDSALLNAINRLKKYEIKYPVDKNALVISEPCKNISEILRQKKRWAVGGMDVSPFGKFIMTMAFLAGLFVLLTPLFFSTISIYLAVFKIATDYFFLLPVHTELNLRRNLRYFLFFEIYLTIYVVSLPVLLIFSRTVTWKGRKY